MADPPMKKSPEVEETCPICGASVFVFGSALALMKSDQGRWVVGWNIARRCRRICSDASEIYWEAVAKAMRRRQRGFAEALAIGLRGRRRP